MKYSIGIRVDPDYRWEIDRAWLRKVAVATLRGEGIEEGAEMGLVVTGDDEVRALNRNYRGLDRTTDVLSFALEEDGEAGFVVVPDGLRHLGEVVISWPQCKRQALRGGHQNTSADGETLPQGERGDALIRNELSLLVAHGVLHLLGWGHDTPARRRKMWKHQGEILAGLGVK
jgi:probable rRNA maturation factor